MKLSIFIICAFLEVCLGNEPQVYENVDDQIQTESNTRIVRQPFLQTKPRIYHPPKFQYEESIQQDQRKHRYAQQQRNDMINILRNQLVKKPDAPLRVSLSDNWKSVDPKILTNQQNYKLPEDKVNVTNSGRVSQTTRKPVTSRKMNPSSYFEDGGQKIKRQDTNQVVYINPALAHNRRSEYDLNALNSLVGQDPNSQLQGLRRLLQTPQSNLVLAPIKSPLPHPITEDVDDIPNPNTHPNVDTNQSIQNVQNQLDQAAKSQLAKALAEAQQQAQAQVDAQYRAIAKAQLEAQKKALAQIALHNEGLKTETLPQPLALVSQVQTEAHRQSPAVPAASSHFHQQQYGDLKASSKANLKKVSITKTHPAAQRQSPNAYQQVVLETQQDQNKAQAGVNQLKYADNVDEHQYAARYAFGYKIRDVKMGNEFGHEEKRDGEGAKGLYHVLLPDGRMQKVEYYAGPSGYHAKVTYENLAHH